MFMNNIRSKSRKVDRAEKRTAFGLKETRNPLLKGGGETWQNSKIFFFA